MRARPGILAAVLFVFLTAELLPIGIVPQLAVDLGVDEARVGLLVTGYAVVAGLALLPATVLLGGRDRRRVVAVALLLLAVGSAVLAVTEHYLVAMVARGLMALLHGPLWALVPMLAADLAPPQRRARSMATVFVGSSLATTAAVPLSTQISLWFGWRPVSMGIGVLALLLAVLVWRVIPAQSASTGGGTADPVPVGRTAVISLITTLAVIGAYVPYTYLALLARRGGITGTGLSLLLAGYGTAGLIGLRVVAGLLDRPLRAIRVVLAGVLIALLVLAVGGGSAPAVTVAVLLWGALVAGLPPALQGALLVDLRGEVAARVSMVYVLAFQIGIAGGAALGSWTVERGGIGQLAPVGAGLLALAVLTSVALGRWLPRRVGIRC